jgi:hypothetical protein
MKILNLKRFCNILGCTGLQHALREDLTISEGRSILEPQETGTTGN